MDVLGIISLIRAYAEVDDVNKFGLPALNVCNSTLLQCFYGIEWEKIGVREGIHYSIGRRSLKDVYVCKAAGLVVKVTHGIKLRGKNDDECRPLFPYAEEVAWKIADLFEWQEIPKTIIVHESEFSKFPYYQHLMLCFFNAPLTSALPITFIFQKIVSGTILPFEAVKRYQWELQKPKICLDSYQRAFLLALLLAKFDAHGGNTMHDPETGCLYEIDNSSIGEACYSPTGALHYLTNLKSQPLSQAICDSIFWMDASTIKQLLDNYFQRNLDLAAIWEKDKFAKKYPHLNITMDCRFDFIVKRFKCIRELSIKEPPPTLEKIASVLEEEFGSSSAIKTERDKDQFKSKKEIEKYLEGAQ